MNKLTLFIIIVCVLYHHQSECQSVIIDIPFGKNAQSCSVCGKRYAHSANEVLWENGTRLFSIPELPNNTYIYGITASTWEVGTCTDDKVSISVDDILIGHVQGRDCPECLSLLCPKPMTVDIMNLSRDSLGYNGLNRLQLKHIGSGGFIVVATIRLEMHYRCIEGYSGVNCTLPFKSVNQEGTNSELRKFITGNYWVIAVGGSGILATIVISVIVLAVWKARKTKIDRKYKRGNLDVKTIEEITDSSQPNVYIENGNATISGRFPAVRRETALNNKFGGLIVVPESEQQGAEIMEPSLSHYVDFDAVDNLGKFTSVKDIGIASDPNPRHRSQMEDTHCIIDGFCGHPSQGYFGVFDGHGGFEIAEYLKENLHHQLEKQLGNLKVSEDDAIKFAFLTTDRIICETSEKKDAGSTAAVAIIRQKGTERWLYVANCGDSRVVICRNGKAERLSYEHKAIDVKEKERVESAGSFVCKNGKVLGVLSVSRSFGDASLKRWVPADPHITSIQLTNDISHLIIASDGLWDVCSDDEAVSIVTSLSNVSTQLISEYLVKYALDRRTRDNVTILVARL